MTKLWQPQLTGQTQLEQFVQQANLQPGISYNRLHQWSIDHKDTFWNLVWDYCQIEGDKGSSTYKQARQFEQCQFFPEAKLNFAQNLLSRNDNHPALVALDEAGNRRVLTYAQLRQQAANMAAGLLASGVKAGDRVAAFLPNSIETVIAALGAAWIGAVFSSCSPDFGVEGVIDRFGQIKPRVFIAASQVQYNGKQLDLSQKLITLQQQLKPNLTLVTQGDIPASLTNTHAFYSWLDSQNNQPDFALLPFDHPLYVMYSSGTTGLPKCIVHGAGGTLLQHAKEHRLHGNLQPNDVLFYYTTCGWMMWNWLVSGLQTGATLVLYDGNPAFPNLNRLFDLVDSEKITHFGTSAKFLQSVEKAGLKPNKTHRFDSLNVIYTTGSPLLHESFDFVYQHIKPDVQLSSISGGTDIISCFVLGNPLLPVWRGELQCAGLGMDIAVYNDEGEQLITGKGELVCRTPFPSKPIYFWNDPDGKRYHDAYFSRFNNIWAHGDYAEACPHDGQTGFIIHGRSDAVLNPGGVRIGTAEIYRQVETLPHIKEALVVGQNWQGDQRVVLFVVMQPNEQLTDELKQTIKNTIRKGASPRHVPAVILDVPALPRTISGKVVEIAVRKVIHGEPVKNKHALANPEALDAFANRPELAS